MPRVRYCPRDCADWPRFPGTDGRGRAAYFGNTPLGKKVEELFAYADAQKGFSEAYKEAQKAHEAHLERARAKLRKEEERREKAKALYGEADALYDRYMRSKSFKIFKQIILEFPDLPEAEWARAVLRKHKKKWKEPK